MDIVVLLLLIVGLTMVIFSWVRADLHCPPPKIIYRTIDKPTLDTQFGPDNYPSEVYKDMFTKSSPWIGGYEMGSGKTFIKSNTNQ